MAAQHEKPKVLSLTYTLTLETARFASYADFASYARYDEVYYKTYRTVGLLPLLLVGIYACARARAFV